MGARTYAFDAFMQFADGAAAMTASGICQVAAANKIIDLGGAPSRTDLGIVGGMARIDMAAVIDISAISTATDGEYNLCILGSNNSDGSKPVVLGSQYLGLGNLLPNGAAGSEATAAGSTTVAGRREILFSTEQNDINYRYVYGYLVSKGVTSHSIQFTGFFSLLPVE